MSPQDHIARCLELAERGRGHVEPNPMVGCVIVQGDEVVGEGWHRAYGQPHAEIEALTMAGARAAGATLYVSLEPCSHYGQTPPCSTAIVQAGIRRVVAAMRDPFPFVDGKGFEDLRAAGVQVDIGTMEAEARYLNAPFLRLVEQSCPWIIAKWAMTLDGKIATHAGESRWITGGESRRVVHELRGRMDGILIGRKTAVVDDPLLTARPPGPRVATRIVLDSNAALPAESQIARTAKEIETMIVVGPHAPVENLHRLSDAGCEVFMATSSTHQGRLVELLEELAGRRFTNVLVEGGGELLGSLWDLGHVDEAHVFIAPKIVGGRTAVTPIAGQGIAKLADALSVADPQISQLGADTYVHGRIRRSQPPAA